MRSPYRHCLLPALVVALSVACDDSGPADTGNGGNVVPPAVSSITPIDVNHIDVLFSKAVTRGSAEHRENYLITESTPIPVAGDVFTTMAPGDTIRIRSVTLKTDERTVTITTDDTMSPVPYSITVSNVKDTQGNKMQTASVNSFTGTDTPDQTPPSIVFRSPDSGETGVGTLQPVIVQFSEPVIYGTVADSLTWSSSGGEVPHELLTENQVTYAIRPLQALSLNTVYTVRLAGVYDVAAPGNLMPTTSWSFTTATAPDTDPPTLIASTPKNLATNVSVNTNLSLTFSEPMNQIQFDVLVTPDVGTGADDWTSDGAKITFDPDLPLASNTQYTLVMIPGSVFDLAGNTIANPITVTFTTGSALATGAITGTIAGDPTSDFANDPVGAAVIAADVFPFGNDDFGIYSFGVVDDQGDYTLPRLIDGVYYLISVLDSNGDGVLDPDNGDALGGYGIDIAGGDRNADAITVTGGATVPGADFPLYDPITLKGTIEYDGTEFGRLFYVGVFDTAGFDPTGTPVLETSDFWPDRVDWKINELDDGLVDGTYYIGAFLDLDGNSSYDPGTDPAGLVGGAVPTPVTIENGADILNINIILTSPGGVALPAGAWKAKKHKEGAAWFRALSEIARRATTAQSARR